MFWGDIGDTDIYKQHDIMMEMRACLFITHVTRSQ